MISLSKTKQHDQTNKGSEGILPCGQEANSCREQRGQSPEVCGFWRFTSSQKLKNACWPTSFICLIMATGAILQPSSEGETPLPFTGL
jgi:hypothetical protein